MNKIKLLIPGLLLSFLLYANTAFAADYTVVKGDSLWQISQKYNINIEKIMELNDLKSDLLSIGQVLHLGDTTQAQSSQAATANQISRSLPPASYIVKPGDTLGIISMRLGITVEEIRRLNNIQGDLIYAGQTLVLNMDVSRGYVDRSRATEAHGMDKFSRYGQLVDWFEEGIHTLKPGKNFHVTDTQTGETMQFKVLGGSNHCDVEPLTQEDTDTMLSLFTNWVWEPRAVCIHVNGRDIAASLSGMPHTNIENIKDNGVTGHFDMYLFNSKPHGTGISQAYVQQHYHAVQRAAAQYPKK